MRRQTVNSLIAGILGMVFVGGSLGGASAAQQSISNGRIYRIHLDINSRYSSGPEWTSFFETTFDKKTSFQSVNEISQKEWDGVKGWVRVKRDGLHYRLLMKHTGKPSQTFQGVVSGNQQEYRVSLNDKN